MVFLALVAPAAPQGSTLPPEGERILASISGDALRGDLSFIASPLLEGRGTPSRGLDIAAEFIAAQFRGAGLEPAGNDGYFQTAQMWRIARPGPGFEIRVRKGARTVSEPNRATAVSQQPVHLSAAPVYKMDTAALPRPEDVKGKVVLLSGRRGDELCAAKMTAALHPAAFLELSANEPSQGLPFLVDPDEEQARYGGVPRFIVSDPETRSALEEAQSGDTGMTMSIELPGATAVPATVRNVVGLLRGSDPALRDQYILLTAHYDHLGRDNSGTIYPGANDDGSGTVSVIEMARALAALPVHPKRSLVFMTFFGEEEGELGSRYYACHPRFPLSATVADLNLEQVGRTDSAAGPEISNATLTGFRYSNISATLREAGKLAGVKVYEAADDESYFDRSDNQTFAEHGIPAHTIAVAFVYPDYHAPGDTWQKIDYGNMAKVDRMIALGALMLADNLEPPQWNRSNASVSQYINVRQTGCGN